LSFDHYDGRAWSRSQKRRDQVRFGGGSRHLVRRIPEEEEDNLVQQIIFQEPLPINVIFGIDTIYRVQIPNTFQEAMRGYAPVVYRERDSDSLLFTYPPKEQSGIRTIVTSIPSSFLPLTRRLKKKQKQRWLRLFTQLPPEISPRVKALAEQITQGKQNVVRKVQAIEEYLRKNYAYSLSRDAEKTNPVEDFLFLQKKGHCEYFSTAMILLLRSLGIPSRQVTGFYGAEWNPYGQYYIVRQSHAHSWGEYLDPQRGWHRFDPTPYRVNDSPPQISFFAWFEDRLDALRLQWYKWIVEFNLEDQLAAFRAIAAGWRSATETLGLRGADRFSLRSFWQRWQMPLGGLLLLGFLLGLLILYRRRKSAPMLSAKQAASQVTLAYSRLLRALALRGWVRRQAETPLEFLQRLMVLPLTPDASPEAPSVTAPSTTLPNSPQRMLTQEDLAVIEKLTHRYLILRFGEAPVLAGEIESLEATTDALVQRLALEAHPSS
jgi:transglutaminase-like putative cysteine protease